MNRLLLLAPEIARNQLYARAGAVPSFHIAPQRTRSGVDLISGRLLGTYNSATPAMAVGPDGLLFTPAANAPVIEYDAATRACLGARIWEAVTQQARATRDLTQSTVWTASAITPTRDQIGTDGTSNFATRLTATASDGTILQTFTSVSATRVSGFWVRRITGTGTVEITMNGGSTWTALTLTSTFARYSIPAATITNPQIGFRIRSNGDEIAVDGVQLQSVATLGPTVFNPSTTLAASSTADVWQITGANFNRIYNQSAVTLYAEAERDVVPTGEFTTLIDARNNTSTEIVKISYITESLAGNQVRAGNVVQAETYLSELTGIRRRRIASAFGTNDVAISANGSVPTTDTTATMPAPDRIYIGSNNGAGIINGYIRELAIFRSRRPNANLQAMTT